MPWENIQLNDGHAIPSIAFGTWTIGKGNGATHQIDQALDVGFTHIDTAQAYRNESETGTAIRSGKRPRSELYVTTKYAAIGGRNIDQSISDSLEYLGTSYVDLYLIHHPNFALPDMQTAWKKMEELKADGKAKSIGVSNFGVKDLKTLLVSANIKPAVNQILLHPYVYARQAPLLGFCAKEGIVVEAYSALTPLTKRPGGPVDIPVKAITERQGVAPEQVLLAWVKAKGAVAVTTSSKKDRLEKYLAAGDLQLTAADIQAIDDAGALGMTIRK